MQRILLFTILLLSNASIWSQTPGNALSFDGTNDYVSAAALPTVFTDITNNDFTIEFWIKANGSGTQRVMHAQETGTDFTSILLNASNEVYFYVYEGSNTYSLTSDAGLTSNWTHVACVWESGTQILSMYVDGVLQVGGAGGSSSNATNNAFALGAKTDGSQVLIGDLDEFRIWDVAKSACEIQGSMNSEFDTLQGSMVVYYQFNEGVAGATNTGVINLPDMSTNYDGTLVNFALTGGSSNWIASGANITALNQSAGGVATALSDSICAGSSYNFGGQTLTATGVYYDTLLAQNGCDSVVTLDLVVTAVDITVNVAGYTLGSAQAGGAYQWLDCDNSFAPLAGETNANFNAVNNGNYAVEVTYNGCVDTSACNIIAGIGYEENNLTDLIKVYPNPTTGVIHLAKDQNIEDLIIIVRSIDGKIVYQTSSGSSSLFSFEIEGAAGVYFVEIFSDGRSAVYKICKE